MNRAVISGRGYARAAQTANTIRYIRAASAARRSSALVRYCRVLMAGREEGRSKTLRAVRRARWWLVGAGAALAPAAALAQERVPDLGWGMHPMWWMWGAGGIVMMLFMLLFWGMVIAGSSSASAGS